MVEDMVQRGYRFWGVDVSHEMIAECDRRFGHLSCTQFRQGTATSLIFPDATFDTVICMGYRSCSALAEGRREMIRVAKPDGDIFVAFPIYIALGLLAEFCILRAVNVISAVLHQAG